MKRISSLLRRIHHGFTAWSCCLFIHAVIPRTSQLSKLQRHAFAYLTPNKPWRWETGALYENILKITLGSICDYAYCMSGVVECSEI